MGGIVAVIGDMASEAKDGRIDRGGGIGAEIDAGIGGGLGVILGPLEQKAGGGGSGADDLHLKAILAMEIGDQVFLGLGGGGIKSGKVQDGAAVVADPSFGVPGATVLDKEGHEKGAKGEDGVRVRGGEGGEGGGIGGQDEGGRGGGIRKEGGEGGGGKGADGKGGDLGGGRRGNIVRGGDEGREGLDDLLGRTGRRGEGGIKTVEGLEFCGLEGEEIGLVGGLGGEREDGDTQCEGALLLLLWGVFFRWYFCVFHSVSHSPRKAAGRQSPPFPAAVAAA